MALFHCFLLAPKCINSAPIMPCAVYLQEWPWSTCRWWKTSGNGWAASLHHQKTVQTTMTAALSFQSKSGLVVAKFPHTFPKSYTKGALALVCFGNTWWVITVSKNSTRIWLLTTNSACLQLLVSNCLFVHGWTARVAEHRQNTVL